MGSSVSKTPETSALLHSTELQHPKNSSEIMLMIRESSESIEISQLDIEQACSHTLTLEYLFNCLTLKEPCHIDIDISKISSLELSHCNLTDLPHVLGLNLKHLGLSHNNLERVPNCIYKGLIDLESLDLSFNDIQDFDSEPGCISKIKKLNLCNNKFVNVPKWFLLFRCLKLEEFNYSNNKAKHYKFWRNSFNIKRLKLKKLELVCSCLIDDDFILLKSFKRLEYLDISNGLLRSINRFDDINALFVDPQWIEIHVLKMNNLSLAIFPEGVAVLESLKELHVSENSLSWIPDCIEYLVNLEVLVVSNNCLVSLPKTLVQLVKLRVLHAFNNYIQSAPSFSSMTNLETLDLYNNSLDYNVLLNADTAIYIDLEGNYYNTIELENFPLYEEKRNNLRNKYCIEDRCDGPKIKEPYEIIDSCSDEEDFEIIDEVKDTLATFDTVDSEEIWDFPPKISKTDGDIDTEDENWQIREEPTVCLKETKTNVYSDDDDWKFEDCDDPKYNDGGYHDFI